MLRVWLGPARAAPAAEPPPGREEPAPGMVSLARGRLAGVGGLVGAVGPAGLVGCLAGVAVTAPVAGLVRAHRAVDSITPLVAGLAAVLVAVRGCRLVVFRARRVAAVALRLLGRRGRCASHPQVGTWGRGDETGNDEARRRRTGLCGGNSLGRWWAAS